MPNLGRSFVSSDLRTEPPANILPDTLDLKLSVRTYSKDTRDSVIRAIKRIVASECEASGAAKAPLINITQSAPATINDGAAVETLKKAFGSVFKNNLVPMDPTTASEDFSLLASSIGVPYVMWAFGGVDPNIWDGAIAKGTINELPNNHSPFFAPAISPTIQTGVDAMTIGALAFLGRSGER
jgi:metal-dependent amidase/aminoacylase/carboxypeptidase family protein